MASVADAFCDIGKTTIARHEQNKHRQKTENFSSIPAKYFYFMDLHQRLLLNAWHAQDVKLNIQISIRHYYTAILKSCNFTNQMAK